MNGEVVKPVIVPQYYAVINEKLEVIEIKTCFYVNNIETRGEEWLNKQLSELNDRWTNFTHLTKSLKKYVLFNVYWSDKDNYEDALLPHFKYLTVWESEFSKSSYDYW